MPKDNIDYSNTIIYKIYCNNDTITDTYVGHTTNFYVRKYQHKNSCNNSKNVLKIYKTIRENGGWDNWNMIEIAKYNCKDSTEARIKEQLHYEELQSTLNSCPPYVDKTKYFCIDCNLQCNSPKQFDNHIKCNLHSTTKQIKPNEENEDVLEKITTINNDKLGKLCFKFYCEHCDYGTCKKSSFVNHNHSKRHKNNVLATNDIKLETTLLSKKYLCDCCDKHFNDRAGLWRHKKNCINKKEQNNYYEGINLKDKDALVLYLLKQNGDLQKSLIELLNK
jgi:hypothetical protein